MMTPSDAPPATTPDQQRQAEELIRRLLAGRRAGEDPDPDQLILDNPSLAGVLEQQLQSLRAAWSIQTGAHVCQSGPLPQVASPAQPGGVGRYEIIDIKGAGAFSVVYRAFDRALRRVVALKVLRPRTAGATLV